MFSRTQNVFICVSLKVESVKHSQLSHSKSHRDKQLRMEKVKNLQHMNTCLMMFLIMCSAVCIISDERKLLTCCQQSHRVAEASVSTVTSQMISLHSQRRWMILTCSPMVRPRPLQPPQRPLLLRLEILKVYQTVNRFQLFNYQRSAVVTDR